MLKGMSEKKELECPSSCLRRSICLCNRRSNDSRSRLVYQSRIENRQLNFGFRLVEVEHIGYTSGVTTVPICEKGTPVFVVICHTMSSSGVGARMSLSIVF